MNIIDRSMAKSDWDLGQIFLVRNLDDGVDASFVRSLFAKYATDIDSHCIDECKYYFRVTDEQQIQQIIKNLCGKIFKKHEIFECGYFFSKYYSMGLPLRWTKNYSNQFEGGY